MTDQNRPGAGDGAMTARTRSRMCLCHTTTGGPHHPWGHLETCPRHRPPRGLWERVLSFLGVA